MVDDAVLGYAGVEGRVSRLAVVAMGVGVAGVVGCFLVLPGLVAVMLGAAAEGRVGRSGGRLRGVGFARWGWMLGLVGMCSGVLVDGVLVPGMGHSRPLSDRSACAANLRGITQSMIVYAAENNDLLPAVTFAPYSAVLNSPTSTAIAATADDAVAAYYRPGKAQAGSVAAGAWILVLKGQVAPKGFICKSDPFAGRPAQQQDGAGRYYDNFQAANQLSYSFAYPWRGDGRVGAWWGDTSDSSLPVACDQAPEEGTGTPPRRLTVVGKPADAHTWNSVNHLGDGQQVAFADSHAEFFRRPDVGQGNDNIFTTSGFPSLGPAQYGGAAASRNSGPMLMGERGPFDVVMYPVRDGRTGK